MKILQIIPIRLLRNRLFLLCILTGALSFPGSIQSVHGQNEFEKGKRPYELDWAGRFTDDHEPLVDFEDMEGWTVEANGGIAEISRSEEEKIWGIYTCKIALKGDTAGAGFILRPPEPMMIRDSFTAVNMWVWNDYWIWRDDVGRGKPMERISLLLETFGGASFEIPFSRELDWPGWYLLHIRLSSAQRKAFTQGGLLKGIRLSNCLIDKEKSVFLDNLSFYKESLEPIDFEVQDRPGVDLAQGQDLGIHTGKERLPFPTREETMLPENLSENYTTELVQEGKAYVFRYQGDDGVLEYHYEPRKGNLGDVTARWVNNQAGILRPMEGGGVRLAVNNEVEGLLEDRHGAYLPREPIALDPEEAELIDCRISGETLVSRWKVSRGSLAAEVEYVFRIWQKSLVIDVHSTGGHAGEVSLGKVRGTENPRLVQIPYWSGEDIDWDQGHKRFGFPKNRPAVLVTGSPEKSLFLSLFPDHYRTGSSRLYFINQIEDDAVTCGGGTRYLPKTNGRRNDCHERLFLTLSPRFEEVLPTIANPPSPWRSEAAQNLVCYNGVKDRESDYSHMKRNARYGMKQVVLLDWESGWRDGSESFTFRTVAAPGKGGDEGQIAYSRNLQELGFRYALYNNYTDLATVNSHWGEDFVTLMPDGAWQKAWFRCYAPKSARAVSMEPAITSIMKDKFNPNAGGSDVHTAITPWMRVDYDARVPGAGTMMTQFYAYGQILLHQQKVWGGPVYSEGGNHYYYSGLVTGNTARDRGYDLFNDAWLVDFDLRKLHPLGCDWGFEMGEENSDKEADRFFAGTIAYGHSGSFFGGMGRWDPLTIRSYYMLQQLQSSYCNALIKEIRYANKNGQLLDVSAAVATDAYRRSQIRLEYDNGLVVWVNGHREESWETPEAELPPAGYYARIPDGSLEVFSAIKNKERVDFVHSPAYDYMDGRGHWLETPWGASDGQLIILNNIDGSRELIPFRTEKFAIALTSEPEATIALDMDRNEMGEAKGELRRGMYHIQPVSGAVSYVLKFGPGP
ncbi:MAG: hypothetical protein GY790_22265 [Bacteroidetes bacterium]|nr:hypothetical protein [Bacteroidota bacterium]